MKNDIRHAIRSLLRSPGYTAVALITLVLGLGANTAVFSLVNGILLAPLPYPAPDELVVVREVNGRGGEMDAAWQNFADWRERSRSFDQLVAYGSGESTVLGGERPLRAEVAAVSAGFLDALRTSPERGRGLLAADHQLGAAPVAVVSDRFFRSQLGSREDAIVNVDGYDIRVVGVMPAGFDFPSGADIWYPLELRRQNDSRTSHNYDVLGRLRSGVALQAADAELDAITLGFQEGLPDVENERGFRDFFPHEVHVASLHQATVGDMRRPLSIMLGASLLLLLVACTNLTSTTLARGTMRQREYAVRHALGAGRGRLMRLPLIEALLLAVTGAAAGFALGAVALRLLPAIAPTELPRLSNVRLDPAAALFTLALAMLSAAVAGLWPGLRASKSAADSLRGGGRTGSGHHSSRVWKLLIGAEVALALLLLIGSGLLLRSFWSVLQVEPGFRMHGLLTATIDPPPSRYATPDARRTYFETVQNGLRDLPGVSEVGLVSAAPMEGIANGLLQVRGGPADDLTADYQIAGDGYFEAMGIPLQGGRTFTMRDREGSAPVAVVNRAFAERAWPGENPVGNEVSSGGMEDSTRWATVVGVVGDVVQGDLTRAARPTVYFTYRQRPYRTWSMTAVLRPVNGDAAGLTAPTRAAIAALDPDVPARYATIEQRVQDTLTTRRFMVLVILAFSALALLLASVGVYGVVSYAVERRRREIGIRLALGAPASSVRRAVQRDYLVAAGWGAVAGTVGALALSRVMASLLFGVAPTDPLTFAAVIVLLIATAWVASFIPALRTTRVDPLETMRAE